MLLLKYVEITVRLPLTCVLKIDFYMDFWNHLRIK